MIEFRLNHRRGDIVNKVVVIDDLIAKGGFGSVTPKAPPEPGV